MFDLIAIPLGWIMNLVYGVVKDYGVSIIIFTLIIKMLTFPVSYNQQKNMARMQAINPKLAKLKKKYPNNPEKMQEEQYRIYQEEGINPMASCLPTLLTMIIIMGVWKVVCQPLTHILRLGGDVAQAQTLLTDWLTQNNITEKALTARPELVILKYAKSNPEIFSSLPGFTEVVQGFNNTVLRLIDLGAQPTLSPEGGWTSAAVALASIPFISGLLQLGMTIYTQVRQKKLNPDAPSMGGMNLMLYIMPIFSVVMAFSMPAGVGFYWIFSSLFSLIQTVALNQYFTPERSARIAAKAREKASRKKPGLDQRMMEQQQAMLAEQNGDGRRAVMQRSAANRVDYSDEEEAEGMSRAELQEYNRQRINEARKRMEEKYANDQTE